MHIGCMVWRIGEVLDFYAQVEWIKRAGMEGIAFHTSPWFPENQWRTFDVRRATAADIRKLRSSLQGFREISIHGEFDNYDLCLLSPNELIRKASVASLAGTIRLAAEIGAKVVTVHTGSSRVKCSRALLREALSASMAELGEMAAAHNVTIGFELVSDYDLALSCSNKAVAVTLDTGHVSMNNGAGYRQFGSIAGLIRHLGARLAHVHIHDYDGKLDHLALGAGTVDIPGTLEALQETGYNGMLCLEMNPDRTTPADIVASGEYINRILGATRQAG